MPQERKLATVLFADIVDSSRAADTFEPEVLRQTLSEAFSGMRGVLTAHGGTVEKFIGDAVMAVFGVPVAHEDDAERAVRAALALRQTVAKLHRRPTLELRIGINSGEVVAGDEEHAESLVTGRPVIVAARLEEAAAPGEILVGELTRRLTAGRFRYGPVRLVPGKGVGEIEATAVGAAVRPSLPGRISPARARFIGRARELARLRETHAEALSRGTALRVLVHGAAGIGKSRLADEFARELAPASLLRGHCLPYGQGITLWPLQEIVREAAGIAPTDSSQQVREKLESAIASIPGASAAFRDWLMSLAAVEPGVADLAPERVHAELASALARYLEGIRRSAVTTIVLEDLHLAEPALLEILDELMAQTRAPALLLVLARPELLERYPAWSAESPDASIVELDPLTGEETALLVQDLLGQGSVEPDVLSVVVSRAEGNPLYVEELAQVILDHGDPHAVPPTLHGVIAARLDRTEPRVKQLIQQASVLGHDFWLDALPLERDSALQSRAVAEAVRRDLISIRNEAGPSGTSTHRFKHALIRDVAYQSTSKVERSRLHDHYARWLRSAAGERGREYAEIVAYHADEAFQLAKQLDVPEIGELGHRAFEALVASATAARDRADFRSSLTFSERALMVADEAPIASAERTRALGHAAMARLRLEPSPEAHVSLQRAIEHARLDGPSEHLVRMLVWRAQVALVDDVDAARALFAEAADAARALADDELISYALWASSQPLEATGELVEQLCRLTEACDRMVRTGMDRWLVDALADISANALHSGDLRTAILRAEEAAALAEERGTGLQRFKAGLALARASLASGKIDSALNLARSTFELGQDLGGPWAMAESSETLAEALWTSGDLAAARRVLEQCSLKLDTATMPAMRGRIARVRALLSRIHLALGERELAHQAAEAARSAAPAADIRARVLAIAAVASVEANVGHGSEAKRLLDEAVRIVERTDYRVLATRVRAESARLPPHVIG